MLAWLWSRVSRSCGGVNRAGRRALHRLARPPRGVIDREVARLLRLPPAYRAEVLRLLPTWQRAAVEQRLRQSGCC